MVLQVNGFFPGELRPDTTVGGCIDIFKNVWPNPEETIKAMEEVCSNPESGVSWRKSTTLGDGSYQNKRTSLDLNVTFSALQGNLTAQSIHNQTYVTLLSSSIPYAKKHHILDLYHEDYNMLKYSGGQECKEHADGDTSTGRSVSAIIYLNNNYEGGDVEFVNFGVKIKPEPGMLLLFPSNYPYAHIAHPVTSGTKYAIVTWLHDRPFNS